ncbi:hypothetical protein FK268_13625 [Tsukamurella sputi]|uniref:XRE family transcriptional regulator n=1 Tax=Tsukamurella sputi TaxID=2591848 RepID=A0A5C5RM85_9ACTN|nr:hypothetical protein [Tsukamurella sputi]TWS23331.1 hypothetical protein FK268_13625 [Tsukamurella sputi]
MSIARAALASALQRAFAEAGAPPSTDVAQSGVGITEQQIREWRSGNNLPATFKELEPLIAYLQVAATAATWKAPNLACDNVTGWPMTHWRELWAAAMNADCGKRGGD